ncbi:hypothetical protein [Saccharomonospora sp. CUA-673]|uniref:hypothetical protein n=1 Tax=Saccharomonospora sp. CUA-673 TaxID=1904969 RepID=UPI0035164291
MGAAQPVVVQQPPHLRMTGDQPRLVPHRGANPVDRTLGLQLPQPGRDPQRIYLLERQLNRGAHRDLHHYTALVQDDFNNVLV